MARLIQKYFTAHPDNDFDEKFREGAGFFSSINCTYKYEKLEGNGVRVYFKYKRELRDQAIFENGKKVGIATLVKPHTITIREGTFVCEGVKKIVDKQTKKRSRIQTVNIRKKFLSKALLVLVDNSNLNLRIECDSIVPETYFFERTKNVKVTNRNYNAL